MVFYLFVPVGWCSWIFFASYFSNMIELNFIDCVFVVCYSWVDWTLGICCARKSINFLIFTSHQSDTLHSLMMFGSFSLWEIPAQNILDSYIEIKQHAKWSLQPRVTKAPSTHASTQLQDRHFLSGLSSLSHVFFWWRFWHQMDVIRGVSTNTLTNWCQLYCLMFPCESMSTGTTLWKMKNFNKTYPLQIGNRVEMGGKINCKFSITIGAASCPRFLCLPTCATENSHWCTCKHLYNISFRFVSLQLLCAGFWYAEWTWFDRIFKLVSLIMWSCLDINTWPYVFLTQSWKHVKMKLNLWYQYKVMRKEMNKKKIWWYIGICDLIGQLIT